MKETAFDRMIRWGKDRGWNQSAIASHLSVLPQHISNWKKRGVPPEWHVPIARIFGRSVDELLGIVDEGEDGQITSALSDDERKLLSAYRKLSKKEKGYLLADAEKYLSDPKGKPAGEI